MPLLFTNVLVHTSVPAEGSSLRTYALVPLTALGQARYVHRSAVQRDTGSDFCKRVLLVVVWCVHRRLPSGVKFVHNCQSTVAYPEPARPACLRGDVNAGRIHGNLVYRHSPLANHCKLLGPQFVAGRIILPHKAVGLSSCGRDFSLPRQCCVGYPCDVNTAGIRGNTKGRSRRRGKLARPL